MGFCLLTDPYSGHFQSPMASFVDSSGLMTSSWERGTAILRMAVEDACEHDMLVQIRWQGRKMAVPLSQLEAIGADESTQEAIGDWHYWVAQGCIL